MKHGTLFLCIFSALTLSAPQLLECGAFPTPKKMVITVPFTHLMAEPLKRKRTYQKCSKQVSQLLFGEHITAHEVHNGLLRVKSMTQKGFWKGKWINCSGWIPQSHAVEVEQFPQKNLVVTAHTAPLTAHGEELTLSFGSYLRGKKINDSTWKIALPGGRTAHMQDDAITPLPSPHKKNKRALRSALATRSMEFLSDPYVWAGRSAYDNESNTVSGVDCSGLTNLLYRSIGIHIPRCSQDQYTQSTKVTNLSRKNVGDLIFVYYPDPNNPGKLKNRISHVMMYLGNDRIIEAEGDFSGHVRVVLGKQRFGKAIEDIKSGEIVHQYKMFAESALGNKKVVNSSPLGKCKVVFGSYLAK